MNPSTLEQLDVVSLAQRLLGCRIRSTIGDQSVTGIISESEAYRAPEDKASHAYNNRRTERTAPMYGPAGFSYVYLCYGIHHLFNIVTGPVDTPHAVLIRAVLPVEGIPFMMKRRNKNILKNLLNGPGKWTQAFNITTAHNKINLFDPSSPIKLLPGKIPSDYEIMATPRIGIAYAEEWADKPWRFLLKKKA